MHRRNFLQQSGSLVAGTLLGESILANTQSFNPSAAKRIALVGTGMRGLTMWGEPVIKEFGDQIKFVGLCDINPGRVATGKSFLKLDCPTFTDIDKMLKETKPDTLLAYFICTAILSKISMSSFHTQPSLK